MRASAPAMARRTIPWMSQLTQSGQPEDRFKHPEMFPMLQLPWWLASTLSDPIEIEFHSDIVYSTINGYYYIRLIDNVMDREGTAEIDLLPAAAFFHTRFQDAYVQYFDTRHAFWQGFRALWFGASEAILREASTEVIDRECFLAVSAKKISPAKIPILAVCYRDDRQDLIEPWSRFCDLLARWCQLVDDLFDWPCDLSRRATATYLLSEASKRKHPEEPVACWLARQGFRWAMGELDLWMRQLRALSKELNSADAQRYLDVRHSLLHRRSREVAKGLQRLAELWRHAGMS